MDSNVLRILHGRDPVPGTVLEEPLQQFGWAAALLALLAELLSVVFVSRALVRWVRGRRQILTRRVFTIALLPLVLDAAILWLGLVYVPEHFDLDLPAIVRSVPDVGLFLVPALVLAAAWAVVRSALVGWLWYRSGRRRGPEGVEASPADLMAPFG
jgi:hypothetical protein